ncbi:hypothetical protein [Massilia eburnea]|uniref:hypothetical protein n=1 Tax=Massilia eburnea TaxID=1776165 RepID=UPI003D6C5881
MCRASASRCWENGYDEENFRSAAALAAPAPAGRPFTLVHSGIIYPSERDPVPLFRALSELKAAGAIDASQLHIVLRATAHDSYVGALAGRTRHCRPGEPWRRRCRTRRRWRKC